MAAPHSHSVQRLLALSLLSLALSACGGGGSGGGGSSATPPPTLVGTTDLVEANDTGSASAPSIATDASGKALAVWQQQVTDDTNHTHVTIWASLHTSAGWAAPVALSNDTGDAAAPRIAFSADGSAVAVWQQTDGTRYSIWANTYTAGGGWGTAQLIESDDTADALAPQVAIDASGNAVAVWQQSDGTRYNIWANTYAAGGSWGSASLIESDDTGDARIPRIASDANGDAVAVWYQTDGNRNVIRANTYSDGVWSGDTRISEIAPDVDNDPASSNDGSAYGADVAVDTSGSALVVWYQYDGVRNRIWANRYDATGGSWTTAALIPQTVPDLDDDPDTDNNGSAFDPRIAIDASGNALAVWYQFDGTRNNIWASRYTGGSWQAAALIESKDGSAFDPQVAIDGSGRAQAVWHQSDGTRNHVWTSRYTAAAGWSTPAQLENNEDGSAYAPQVTFDSSNKAITVWHQSDGVRLNIWGNLY